LEDRRSFLALMASAGSAVTTQGTAVAIRSSAHGRVAGRTDRIIINSCGGFDVTDDLRQVDAEDPPPGSGIDPHKIEDALASGMTAANQTVGYVLGSEEPYEATVRELALWELIFRHEPRLLKVYAAADIDRAERERSLGIVLGFQNAAQLGTQLDRVDTFAALGVRIIQLTYNHQNLLGGGALTPGNPGLTPFGQEVVAKLNQRRIIIDLSHSGAQLCLDSARASVRPVAISHTGCRAITDHPRNTADETLRLVASRGGYVGIYFMPFLTTGRTATAEDLLAHLEQAIDVCGEDHVGIGTDGGTSAINIQEARAGNAKQHAKRVAAGIAAPGESADTLNFIPELSGPGQFQTLAVLLQRRGHSSGRIEKILGRNFLRFAKEIWGA